MNDDYIIFFIEYIIIFSLIMLIKQWHLTFIQTCDIILSCDTDNVTYHITRPYMLKKNARKIKIITTIW